MQLTTAPHDTAITRNRQIWNKVPTITLVFWIIKILATTVGETAADFLNVQLHLGLSGTTVVMGSLLLAALTVQLRVRRYVPALYWLAVVLLSVVGTLITDNLTDNVGLALTTATAMFALALMATFVGWYACEKTLSIHTIVTTRREGFYWLTILFTFALGTAAGDLTAERLSLGYLVSALMFGTLIAAVTLAHRRFMLPAIPAFWCAYILTRPLGASLGDFLAQPRSDGGLGLGTIGTSALFLGAIVGLVTYLSVRRAAPTLVAAAPERGASATEKEDEAVA